MVGEGCDECGKHQATHVCNGGMYLCDTHAQWHRKTGHNVVSLPHPMNAEETAAHALLHSVGDIRSGPHPASV